MRPRPPPYPTAGSVKMSGMGMKPYFSSKKTLKSNQPSGERNFETAFVPSGSLVTFVCAGTAGAHRAKAIQILKPHKANNGQRLKCRVTVEARMPNNTHVDSEFAMIAY